jgi:hypothetical protein
LYKLVNRSVPGNTGLSRVEHGSHWHGVRVNGRLYTGQESSGYLLGIHIDLVGLGAVWVRSCFGHFVFSFVHTVVHHFCDVDYDVELVNHEH